MTPDERLELFVELCRREDAVLRARPDRAALLQYEGPLPPFAEEAWLRLVREANERKRSPRQRQQSR